MNDHEKAEKSRRAVLVLLAVLISYYLWSHYNAGVDVALRSMISTLPLAIFIPGLIRRRYRTASLLCFVLLLYFMVAVHSLFTPGNLLAETVAMGSIVSLFVASMLYSRWQQRADVFE